MKTYFRSYHRPTEEEFSELWERGVFVFDTNVLLELYSYPEETREALFGVLEKLGERVWIPYHVALEYHRNRLSRIAQSAAKLEQLSKTIQATSKSVMEELRLVKLAERGLDLPDLDDRLNAIEPALRGVQEAIAAAMKKLPTVSLEDPIRDRVYQIFDGRAGAPPESQAELDSLIADAGDRIKRGIPPGFQDADKDVFFRDNGIDYEGKFGDLILWKQLLHEIRRSKLDRVVFVTGDAKEDWWFKYSGKTLGPRPELVQEALSCMTNGVFWMYKTHQFLEFARKELSASVPDEAINRVKEASAELFVPNSGEGIELVAEAALGQIAPLGQGTEHAIEKWLQIHFSGLMLERRFGFPDYTLRGPDVAFGFEVLLWDRASSPNFTAFKVKNLMERAEALVQKGTLSAFWILFVLPKATRRHQATITAAYRSILLSAVKDYPNSTIVMGAIVQGQFVPTASVGARGEYRG